MGVKNQHETFIRKKKSQLIYPINLINLPHYGMMYF